MGSEMCIRDRSIGVLEGDIRLSLVLGVNDSEGSSAQELRTVGPVRLRDLIKLRHELVIELDEHLTTGHDHMVHHMVARDPRRAVPGVRRFPPRT